MVPRSTALLSTCPADIRGPELLDGRCGRSSRFMKPGMTTRLMTDPAHSRRYARRTLWEPTRRSCSHQVLVLATIVPCRRLIVLIATVSGVWIGLWGLWSTVTNRPRLSLLNIIRKWWYKRSFTHFLFQSGLRMVVALYFSLRSRGKELTLR